MSWPRQVWHVFAKDVREQRWLLLLYCVLLAVAITEALRPWTPPTFVNAWFENPDLAYPEPRGPVAPLLLLVTPLLPLIGLLLLVVLQSTVSTTADPWIRINPMPPAGSLALAMLGLTGALLLLHRVYRSRNGSRGMRAGAFVAALAIAPVPLLAGHWAASPPRRALTDLLPGATLRDRRRAAGSRPAASRSSSRCVPSTTSPRWRNGSTMRSRRTVCVRCCWGSFPCSRCHWPV